MSIDTPNPDFTVMTITHTGTRWIDSCFQNANIPIKMQHFGWGRPIEGKPFTLLRDPYDVIKSFIYRELEVKSYINQLDMQEEFLSGIWLQGGVNVLEEKPPYFCVEEGIDPINDHYGLNIPDSKIYHSEEYNRELIDVNDEWIDAYYYAMELEHYRENYEYRN